MSEETFNFADLIQYVAERLVDHPEEVSVNEAGGDKTTVLELSLAQEDLGRVIGRDGRTAQALRSVLGASASKQNARAILEILD